GTPGSRPDPGRSACRAGRNRGCRRTGRLRLPADRRTAWRRSSGPRSAPPPRRWPGPRARLGRTGRSRRWRPSGRRPRGITSQTILAAIVLHPGGDRAGYPGRGLLRLDEDHGRRGQTMNSSRTEVSAELGLGLVSPENTIVPLMAGLSYTSADPYAVRMAFDVGTDKPVEWILARDPPAGIVPDVSTMGAGARHGILNIAMSSPFGQAQFEVSAQAIGTFLERTYRVVPAGQESGYLDFDAELTELLSQA